MIKNIILMAVLALTANAVKADCRVVWPDMDILIDIYGPMDAPVGYRDSIRAALDEAFCPPALAGERGIEIEMLDLNLAGKMSIGPGRTRVFGPENPGEVRFNVTMRDKSGGTMGIWLDRRVVVNGASKQLSAERAAIRSWVNSVLVPVYLKDLPPAVQNDVAPAPLDVKP